MPVAQATQVPSLVKKQPKTAPVRLNLNTGVSFRSMPARWLAAPPFARVGVVFSCPLSIDRRRFQFESPMPSRVSGMG
jgi:hypothetical protein